MSAPTMKCRHGKYFYTGRTRDIGKAAERKADEHEQKCKRGGTVFVHPGSVLGLLVVACCGGCGRRVA